MALGAKKIETRSWCTSYRGWLAIQASKGGLSMEALEHQCWDVPFREALAEDPAVAAWMNCPCDLNGNKPNARRYQNRGAFPFGKIVGVVYLKACTRTSWLREPAGAEVIGSELMTPQEQAFGDFSDGRYGWVTDKLFRLPDPIAFKAKQGLCSVSAEVIEEIRKQWKDAPR
jgi:activating signal cointegrator 1